MNADSKKEEEDYLARGDPNEEKATFIKDMNKNLYNNDKETLEGRLGKYKHYRQKGNSDRHSFL